MPGSNPVSEKERAAVRVVVNSWIDDVAPRIDSVQIRALVNRVAQALADARAEGYVAGVEDAAKVARGYMTISSPAGMTSMGDLVADHFTEALIGPKKEGGG